ncbi:MAG: haloacid dehalogenase-like hydrolase [Dysgonamonadaceae bacterium]|nr:haloacid dehalogenase-like hydrolase [Dysgonamonadaceae bacterium]
MTKQIIAVFDFDGTITTKDTLLEFIKFSKGRWRFYAGLLCFSPLLTAMKLNLYPNGKVKEKIFSCFYKGMKMADFNEICKKYAISRRNEIVRKKALQAIENHLQNGDKVVIVSASIENWVRPFAEQAGISDLLCTEIEVDGNGLLTGCFLTKNCYGQEKVNRLLVAFPNRVDYYLIAYGDNRGDREMIDFADEGYYNNFR